MSIANCRNKKLRSYPVLCPYLFLFKCMYNPAEIYSRLWAMDLSSTTVLGSLLTCSASVSNCQARERTCSRRTKNVVNIQSSSEEDIRRLPPAQKKRARELGKITHLLLKVSKTKDQLWRDKQRTTGDAESNTGRQRGWRPPWVHLRLGEQDTFRQDYKDTFGKLWRLHTDFKGTIRPKRRYSDVFTHSKAII